MIPQNDPTCKKKKENHVFNQKKQGKRLSDSRLVQGKGT
jgi:hypothetical protein